MFVNTLTLFADVVESSLISQNFGIVNAEKRFEDEPDRSYRFGVMSKNVNYNNNSHTKMRNFKLLLETRCLQQSCSPGPGDDRYESFSQIGVTVSEFRVFKVTMEEIFK